VEKDFEARVTVVGRELFPCRIDTAHLDPDKGGTDWRAGYTHGLVHSRYTPPEAVSAFCREYLEDVGLHFGCFDFIVDGDGSHWFLECNPNGQWMWIEEETGLPISAAIAEQLATAGGTG
jgi:glutathione synthase/RimK-type ligase-like ATP-grasp enzyme